MLGFTVPAKKRDTLGFQPIREKATYSPESYIVIKEIKI